MLVFFLGARNLNNKRLSVVSGDELTYFDVHLLSGGNNPRLSITDNLRDFGGHDKLRENKKRARPRSKDRAKYSHWDSSYF